MRVRALVPIDRATIRAFVQTFGLQALWAQPLWAQALWAQVLWAQVQEPARR